MAQILVVEDNPMNMELVVDLLETYGYEVTPRQKMGLKHLNASKRKNLT